MRRIINKTSHNILSISKDMDFVFLFLFFVFVKTHIADRWKWERFETYVGMFFCLVFL